MWWLQECANVSWRIARLRRELLLPREIDSRNSWSIKGAYMLILSQRAISNNLPSITNAKWRVHTRHVSTSLSICIFERIPKLILHVLHVSISRAMLWKYVFRYVCVWLFMWAFTSSSWALLNDILCLRSTDIHGYATHSLASSYALNTPPRSLIEPSQQDAARA